MELFGVEVHDGMMLRVLLLSFLVQVSLSSSADKTDSFRRFKRSTNCDAKFSHIPSHTACLSASNTATSAGVSASDQTLIVNTHNTFRSSVSPTATNMRQMSWDDEVAMIAQKWAEYCQYGHDDGYSRYIPGRFSVGQNIASGHASWTAAMNAWHSEVSEFTLGGSNVFSDVGHYTQIVWAETSKIGCGFAVCSGSKYYVCNYSPAGNFDYNNPYSSGNSCADCPTSCNNKLCDCGGKVCLNRAPMDINTCGCTCNKPYLVGNNCALNCTGLASDPSGCGTPPNFVASRCPDFANLPTDCPLMCQTCPHGDSSGGSVTQTSTTSSTTSSQSSTTTSTTSTQSPSASTQQNGDSTTDGNAASRSLCNVIVMVGMCILFFLL